MKVKHLHIIIISILYISFSCGVKYKKNNISYFTRTDFQDSIHVELDTIPISQGILNPISFNVMKDSLLLVRNAQNSEYMIEIYNLNTQQFITKTARWGRGPFEVLGGFLEYRSDKSYFLFHDMISRRFQIYNIDSLLAYKENYQPIVQTIPSEGIDIALIDSSNFVIYDVRYLENKKFSNGVPELSIEAFNSGAKYVVKDFKYSVGNINGGKIYVSSDHSKIVVFSRFDDKINIYNHQLVLQKTLKGPDNFVPEYTTQRNSGGILSILCKNRIRYGYRLGFATTEHIYTVYKVYNGIGNYTEVFKLSWDGEQIKRYIVKYDINVLSISNGYIYATGFESQHSGPKLVRFKI